MIGTFTKNVMYTLLTQGLNLVIGLANSIVIARVLGPKGRGIYAIVTVFSLILVYLTSFNIGTASIFYLGEKKYSPKEAFGNNIIWSIFTSGMAIVVGLILIYSFRNKVFQGVEIEYLMMGLCIAVCIHFYGNTSYILLGLQKIRRYNFISFLRAFVFFVSLGIVLLLGLRFSVIEVMFAEIIALLVTCFVLFKVTKNEAKGICLKVNKSYFKDTFSYGVKVWLGNLLSLLNLRIDVFLINGMLNPLAVGFYSIATGLSEKIKLISDGFETVLFPRITGETDKKNLKQFIPLIFRTVQMICVLTTFIMYFIGRWLISLLYSNAYLDSVQPFKIMIFGVMSIGGWKTLENYLQGRGRPTLCSVITGISVLANLILNILWIPKYGIKGAAWATVVSYNLGLLITLYFYRKVSENRLKDILFIRKGDVLIYKNVLRALFPVEKIRMKAKLRG